MRFILEDGTIIEASIRMSEQTPKSVHIMPTRGLLRLHSTVDRYHSVNPENAFYTALHTVVKHEMELRGLNHVDYDDYEWEPVAMDLPNEPLEEDELMKQFIHFVKYG